MDTLAEDSGVSGQCDGGESAVPGVGGGLDLAGTPHMDALLDVERVVAPGFWVAQSGMGGQADAGGAGCRVFVDTDGRDEGEGVEAAAADQLPGEEVETRRPAPKNRANSEC
ncbi:hypothetical protein GCM10023080_030330 [Streptomyces pseudoechinosporeus]